MTEKPVTPAAGVTVCVAPFANTTVMLSPDCSGAIQAAGDGDGQAGLMRQVHVIRAVDRKAEHPFGWGHRVDGADRVRNHAAAARGVHGGGGERARAFRQRRK